MKEVDKAWLACAIDGEGNIQIRKYKRNTRSPVTIQITNTDRNFLERAKEIVPEGHIYPVRRRRRNERPVYTFNLCEHKAVLNTLVEILPYLIIKKRLAEEAIEFIQSYKWRFNSSEASPELVHFILKEAEKKGIRPIAKDVEKKFGLNIHSSTVLNIIKSQGQWVRHCLICGEPFEVSQKYRKYCPKHTLSKSVSEKHLL